VATYIQSGNVIFETEGGAPARLAEQIQSSLSDAFGYGSWVIVRSRDQMKSTVEGAPAGFGEDSARYLYDALFLKEPLTAKAAMVEFRVKPEVDAAFEGDGVLYFSRLRARASSSYLSRVASLPVYKNMTIRNWNTTARLLAILET
jgi:uncharacterized protein (DUF1697 family)